MACFSAISRLDNVLNDVLSLLQVIMFQQLRDALRIHRPSLICVEIISVVTETYEI